VSVPNFPVPVFISLGVALSECLKNKVKKKIPKRWLTERKKYSVAGI
jgi:hypothetical protein